MANLEGKVAVVTGASGGIGRATAERLARDGASVVVHYSGNAGKAEEVVRSVESEGGKAISLQANVEKRDEVRALFEAVDARFGRVDILVNNAGIFAAPEFEEVADAMETLGSISDATVEHLLGVNVKGTIYAAQEAARRMGDGGRIVNTSSTAPDFPQPGTSLYTASKLAVRGLTEVWAKELAPRAITVNTVVPGPTEPGMRGGTVPEWYWETSKAASPSGRVGDATEVASVTAFLCSDDASWVSGQHVIVNGASNA